MFDILMVFLKEFFQKVNFEKNQQTTNKHEKLPSMQWVKLIGIVMTFLASLLLELADQWKGAGGGVLKERGV